MIRTLPFLLLSTSLCDLLKGPYGDGSASDTDPGSTSEVTGDAGDDGITLPTGEPTTGQDDPEPVCLVNPIVGSTDGNFLELCEILVDPHDGGVIVVGAFGGTLTLGEPKIEGQFVEAKQGQVAFFAARFAASGAIEWIEGFDESGLSGCSDAVMTPAGDVAIVDAEKRRILVLRASAEPRLWKSIALWQTPVKIEIVGDDDILLAGWCDPDNLWLATVDPDSIEVKDTLCEEMPGVIPRALAADPNPPGSAWVGATQKSSPALIARVNLSPLEISDIQDPDDTVSAALSVAGDTVYSLEYSNAYNDRVRLRSYPPGADPGLAEIGEGRKLTATDMMFQGGSLLFALETDDESGSTVDLWRVTADNFADLHTADIAGEPKWAGPPIVTASPPCGVLFGGSRYYSPEPFTIEGAEILAAKAPNSFFVTLLPSNFVE